ncbi:MAG TPA: hypothetical protein VF941_07165 [Clostridia bacterium]
MKKYFIANIVVILSMAFLCSCAANKNTDTSVIPTTSPQKTQDTNKDLTISSNNTVVNSTTTPCNTLKTPEPVHTQAPVTPVPKKTASETTAANSIKPVSEENEKEAEDLYNKGFQVYLSRKYDDAIEFYNMALSKDPNSYKSLNGKGIALCFQGEYDEGMILIKKALSIKPDFPYSNFNMALSYKLQKDFDSANVWFDKAISYDPKDTWSYFGKACIYAERMEKEKAFLYLKKAIETDTSVKDAAIKEHDLDNIKDTPEFNELVK